MRFGHVSECEHGCSVDYECGTKEQCTDSVMSSSQRLLILAGALIGSLLICFGLGKINDKCVEWKKRQRQAAEE